MMRHGGVYLGSAEAKNERLPLRCVSAFGESYLIDRGPGAQRTRWLQGLGAAEVIAQGKERVTGAGGDGSGVSEIVPWLRWMMICVPVVSRCAWLAACWLSHRKGTTAGTWVCTSLET